jgi:hypothetical protein
MSCGVGLPEELAKAAVGLLILYAFFDTQSLSPANFRRLVLAAFAVAGLGFGAGEAIKYFGVYAHNNLDLFHYLVRATWCVMLHGAWTLLIGVILVYILPLPQELSALKDKAEEVFFGLLCASIPVAVVHGLYDACCVHDGVATWLVGGVSLLLAVIFIGEFSKEKESEIATA